MSEFRQIEVTIVGGQIDDSSKYGAHSLFNVVPLSRFTDVITDVNLPQVVQAELKAQSVALTLVQSEYQLLG